MRLLSVLSQKPVKAMYHVVLVSSHTKLLLPSKLYLWGSPFWERFLLFLKVTLFNPTIVTVCLHGWCVLDELLLLAFTCLGHECHLLSGSFESMQWNACVHRLDLGLNSIPKEFWRNGVRNHVNSNKGKNPLYRRLRGRSNPWRYITQDSEPNTLPTVLFLPPCLNKIEEKSMLTQVIQLGRPFTPPVQLQQTDQYNPVTVHHKQAQGPT